MSSSLTRIILAFTLTTATVYGGLYLLQDQIIFQSSSLDRHYRFEFDRPFQEHFIPVLNDAGTTDTLNAISFEPDSVSRGLILYFHGNRGNLRRWGQYASKLTQFGYDVLAIDYRGYGKSTGHSTESNLYADAKAAFEWARQRKPGKQIVVYGRSLGSAVATHLAASVQPGLLILETPFNELAGVIEPYGKILTPLLPLKYTFSNEEHLKSFSSRLVVFHGTEDHIVPLRSALKLKPYVKSPGDFVIIQGGSHRNLSTFQEYRQKLRELLEGHPF